MALYDTLEYAGTERRLDAWGFALASCLQRLGNSKADTWTGTIPQASIASDPLFPYFASVIIRTNRASAAGADGTFSGGTIMFQGKRVKNPMKATAQGQGVTYEFQGPWYDLDITQYLQSYKGVQANYFPGEIILNTAAAPLLSTAGLRFISVGDQVQCILQFVLDGYAAQGLAAPFQYIGRELAGGAINLDCAGNAGTANENTDEQGNIYNQKLSAGNTIDTALYKFFLKSEIVRPMNATQALQKLLDSSPRTNIAFDYSIIPPRIHVVNVDNLPPQNLPLFDGANHKSINLQRRDDLLVASVIIGYRITNSINGQQEVDYAMDKWGPNGDNNNADPNIGPGVIVQTLELTGFSQSISTAKLTTSPLAAIGGTQATKRSWWASKQGGDLPELEDSRVRFQDSSGKATTIPDAKFYYVAPGVDSTGAPVAADQEFTAADYALYNSRIVEGTHHSWMELNGGAPVLAVKAKVKVQMPAYTQFDATSATQSETDTAGNKIIPHNTADKHTVITVTNGISGTYDTTGSFTPGEFFIQGPGGIAQYLFNMLSVLQYEGEYVKVEASFALGVSLLNRLNLTGGRAEWETMNAQIQDIELDWGRKTISVRIGISKHLSADQLSAFLNMWRFRRAWYNPLLKADNTVAGAGDVTMPDAMGNSNTMPGLDNTKGQSWFSYTNPPAGAVPGTISAGIIINPDHLSQIDALN